MFGEFTKARSEEIRKEGELLIQSLNESSRFSFVIFCIRSSQMIVSSASTVE
jgi:hypothetical protein